MQLSSTDQQLLNLVDQVQQHARAWINHMNSVHDDKTDTSEWDLPACLFFQDPTDPHSQPVGLLIEQYLRSDRSKQAFFEHMFPQALEAIADKFGAPVQHVAMHGTAWMATVDRTGDLPDVPVRDMPDRQERAFIVATSVDACFASNATIRRRVDAPPVIGEWSDPLSGPDGSAFGGAMLDAVRSALSSQTK